MDAVISLLDEKHTRIIEGIWKELESRFGVSGAAVTPYAHFSYQIADCYAQEKVERALRRVAVTTSTFTVRTAGIGIFTGADPVLFVPVVKSPGLARLHEHLWNELSGAGSNVPAKYAPDAWVPHITLGHGDIDRSNLPGIVEYLAERRFDWEISIDNLALIYRVGGEQGMHVRYPLSSNVPPLNGK